jgi:phosphomannomutase
LGKQNPSEEEERTIVSPCYSRLIAGEIGNEIGINAVKQTEDTTLLHVLAALGEQDRPLSALMDEYQRYAASGEINFRVDDAPGIVNAVVKSYEPQTISVDHLDGVTVDLGNGSWFNLRTSNTEPLLRLNVESPSVEIVNAIVNRVADEISARSEARA